MEKRMGQKQCFEKLKSVGLFAQFENYEDFEVAQEKKRKVKEEKTSLLRKVKSKFCFK